MKKWAMSAVVYLLVVVGGYYAYASFFGTEEATHSGISEQHKKVNEYTETSEEHGQSEKNSHEEGHGDDHSEHGETSENSEVLPLIHEESGKIVISLKDMKGSPVTELEVNHEKLMHLIVVGSDLQDYKHLHPELKDPGVYHVEHGLEDGEYKFFIDIKPKGLAYEVKPVSFIIGSPEEAHDHHTLQVDQKLTQQAENHSVTLQPTSLKANEDIQLKFDLNGETPEPYLGALGHVVILDEKAEEYIHVHPHDGDEPIFETKFSEPGIYKIWAEFKFTGEVFVFPYVVEIEG